jgi:hypothetical protein
MRETTNVKRGVMETQPDVKQHVSRGPVTVRHPIDKIAEEIRRLGPDKRHSELWRLLFDEYGRIVRWRESGTTWPVIAAAIGVSGLTDRKGRPPSANTVRWTFWSVKQAKERRAVKQGDGESRTEVERVKVSDPPVIPTPSATPFRLTEPAKPARSFLTPTRPKGE